MKKCRLAPLLAFVGSAWCYPGSARAEFLFNSFLTPSFSTQYSAWDVFYTPYGNINYPDFAAPYGTRGTAPAGYTIPPNANPSNPVTYWDTRNATITQTGTSSAFIIGPGVAGSGNIYSFAAPTSYVLNNSVPAGVGTVAFQFQTDGALVDFASIKLRYTNGSGALVSLSPNDMLREYRTSGSSFGGITNRTAVQWNLTGLGITSYQLVYSAVSSSNSFQLASLDTAASYGDIIPAARFWTAGGAGNWGNGVNWQQGTTSNENGNVHFLNPAAVAPVLDANHTVGEVRFDTPANVAIGSPGGYTLTANTGIATTAAATGGYTINASYQFGAFNIFDIAAGDVRLGGVVSGNYGFEKDGAGSLTFSNNNTFTGAVTVVGGTLRMSGTNAYIGSTSLIQGSLIVGGDALVNVNGPLGNAASNLTIGADSSTTQFAGASSATLTIDGDYTVSRGIDLANGTYEKRLSAINTSAATGATYAGAINFTTAADNVHLAATTATDKVTFSGAMGGGSASSNVVIDGAGTVVFSGAAKTYANATNVNAGMLRIATGTAFTGSGALGVNNGATLRVDGTLGGSGALTISAGVLTGVGTVSRDFNVGTAATISPGNGVGTLNTGNETWLAGGSYRWEINAIATGSGTNPGQDLVNLTGILNLDATAANRFTLQLRTLTTVGSAGPLTGFDPTSNYSWRLVTANGGITGFDAAAFQVDSSSFANAPTGKFSVSESGNDLFLNYAAVPEPSTWIWIVLGLLGIGHMKRQTGRRSPGCLP